MTEQQPGDDWIYVEEGEQKTPEQMTRYFLSLTWAEQVDLMTSLFEDVDTAQACRMLNHEGAYIFATQHSCAPAPAPETIQGEIVEQPFYAVEWTPAPPVCPQCRTVHQ